MISKFLPDNFDKSKTLTIIAGKGNYPILLAKNAKNAGVENICIIGFEGETDLDFFNSFDENKRKMINVGQIAKLLNTLVSLKTSYAILAGQITPKKLFKGLKPDLLAIWTLAKLKERNAITIFGKIVELIEKKSVTLLDARSFLDEDLASYGFMGGKKIRIKEEHLLFGINVASEVSRLNIGQSVVVSKGSTIAVEAFEGTDETIKRAATFNAKKAILVKTIKTGQDFRFDVPVFGEKTLQNMHQSNIFIAALEADKTIILNKKQTLEKAKELGICILGFKR